VRTKATKATTRLVKALMRLTKAMRRSLKLWICMTMTATIRELSTNCFHSLCHFCREDECEFIEGQAEKKKKKRKPNRRRATEQKKRRKTEGAKSNLKCCFQ